MNSFKRHVTLFKVLPKRGYNFYRNCPIQAVQIHACGPLDAFFRTEVLLKCCSYRSFCTNSNDTSTKFTRRKEEIRAYLEHNKEKLKDTEQRLKQRGHVLLQDLKDTKSKVKERVEEIAEVTFRLAYN